MVVLLMVMLIIDRHQLSSLPGDDVPGSMQLISEASVEISDNKSSCGDRVAVISGKPKQKRTTESLI
ncbi:hypothetical protein Tco_1505936 [Tanacetum coccineum]